MTRRPMTARELAEYEVLLARQWRTLRVRYAAAVTQCRVSDAHDLRSQAEWLVGQVRPGAATVRTAALWLRLSTALARDFPLPPWPLDPPEQLAVV